MTLNYHASNISVRELIQLRALGAMLRHRRHSKSVSLVVAQVYALVLLHFSFCDSHLFRDSALQSRLHNYSTTTLQCILAGCFYRTFRRRLPSTEAFENRPPCAANLLGVERGTSFATF